MKVRVKPSMSGYFGERRRRAGDVFDMPAENLLPLDEQTGKPLTTKNGGPRLCSWVEVVNQAELDKLLVKHGFKPVGKPAAKPGKVEEPEEAESAPAGAPASTEVL